MRPEFPASAAASPKLEPSLYIFFAEAISLNGDIIQAIAMDETPRLAVDRMLMRLARWLRLLGADVIADESLTGAQLLRIARADNRILVTRDKRLRTAPDVFFVASNSIRGQLREAIRRFGLDPRAITLTRCSRCNTVLTTIARELVSRRVPPYVFASHDRFAECGGCGRIYWPETHPARMHAMLDSIGL
jgi:uncharacterized protein with PIN domain